MSLESFYTRVNNRANPCINRFARSIRLHFISGAFARASLSYTFFFLNALFSVAKLNVFGETSPRPSGSRLESLEESYASPSRIVLLIIIVNYLTDLLL